MIHQEYHFIIHVDGKPHYRSQDNNSKGYGNRFRAERAAKESATGLHNSINVINLEIYPVYYMYLPDNHPVILALAYMTRVGNQWYKKHIDLPQVDYNTEAINQ